MWDEHGLRIPTVNNFRDIGTHLNLSAANNGKTLTDRMIKARHMTNRLRWIPISLKDKEHIILANILPAGLYVVEAAWVNKSTLKALRSAIARAIGPRSARASTDIVYNNTSCSADLDLPHISSPKGSSTSGASWPKLLTRRLWSLKSLITTTPVTTSTPRPRIQADL